MFSMPNNLNIPTNLQYKFTEALSSKKLLLSGLQITDNFLTSVIIPFLNQNPSIMELDVSENQIGVPGATALAANTTLTTLNVRLNQICIPGARALAGNTTLTTLDVSGNKIGDNGAIALAANTTLRTLDVSDNQINNNGKQKLQDVVTRFLEINKKKCTFLSAMIGGKNPASPVLGFSQKLTCLQSPHLQADILNNQNVQAIVLDTLFKHLSLRKVPLKLTL